MEIKIDNINFKNEEISLQIKDNGIYSFVGNSKSIKKDIMNKIILTLKDKYEDIKVGVLYSNPYKNFTKKNITEHLENILRIYDYSENSIDKRIKDAFKIVDINIKYLDANINDLNYTDAMKMSLLAALIHNPKIIILEDYTDTMLNSDKKELSRLLRRLKNKYNKIILLFTKDTQFAYEVSDYAYLLDNESIIDFGNRNIFTKIDLLNKIGLEVPPIIKFTSTCNKNNHDIDNYVSILDLIKAIYRDIM